jgi:hypothetical protein
MDVIGSIRYLSIFVLVFQISFAHMMGMVWYGMDDGVIVTEITRHVRAAANAPFQPRFDLPWFVRHRNLVKPMFLFKFTVALMLSLLVLWFILVAAFDTHFLIYECPSIEVIVASPKLSTIVIMGQWLPIIYILTSVVPLAFLARQLSKQKEGDAFGVLTELKTIGYSCAILVLLEIPEIVLSINPWWTPLLIMSAMMAVFVPTIVVPIVRSYQFQTAQRRQASVLSRVNRVEELLVLPQGYELFAKYCQSEFCSEGNSSDQLLIYYSHLMALLC